MGPRLHSVPALLSLLLGQPTTYHGQPSTTTTGQHHSQPQPTQYNDTNQLLKGSNIKDRSPEEHGTEPPLPAWFSHLTYPSESDSDTGEGDEEEDMDTTQPLPTDPPSTHQEQEPIPPAPSAPIKDLIEAAIKEAQRAAREEYQRELAQMTLRHQHETG